MENKQEYLDRMKEIAAKVLKKARAAGADYAQCTASESEKREFNVDGGRFSLMRTLFDRGVTLTVLKDRRKGSVAINRFDEDALTRAVADGLAASEGAEPDDAWQFEDVPVDRMIVEGEPVCDSEALFARTRELLEDIHKRHPKILMEQMITEHQVTRRAFLNTSGVSYCKESGAYSFSLMYSAHEGEKSSSFYGSDVTLANLDRPVISCALIERELAAVEKQIETRPLQGKFTGPVILAPAAFYEIVLSTILGNFVSDSSLIDGTSIWKEKLGQQVADSRLTVSFTPHSEDVVLGQDYTGEGYPAVNFDLIREGKLVSFNLSQYGANRTGGVRAGCACGNITVPAGNESLEEMIRDIDRGILVMRFSGGSPASSGEFSGVAKNSFLIENGIITDALAETMISGCVPEMLNNLRGLTKDTLRDGSISLPYAAFNNLMISGK